MTECMLGSNTEGGGGERDVCIKTRVGHNWAEEESKEESKVVKQAGHRREKDEDK